MAYRIVSLVRPTPGLHIGQYFGAVVQWLNLQKADDNECLFGIGDLHQMTLPFQADASVSRTDRELIGRHTISTAMDLFACGIDPSRVIVFVQSLVPEHMELFWILNCLCSYGELPRMSQFRKRYDRYKNDRSMVVSAGLLGYPVLQAADILVYKGVRVPVGGDQKPHIELAQRLSRAFNKRFAGVFPVPAMAGGKVFMALRDPELKMSRSGGDRNYIGLFEEEAGIRFKIEKAKTSTGVISEGPLSPGVENLLAIFRAANSENPERADALREELTNGRIQFKDFKSVVADAVVEGTRELRKRRRDLEGDRNRIEALILEMSGAARSAARETLVEVRKALCLHPGPTPRSNWWQFDVRPSGRENTEENRLGGYMEINPVRDGKLRLSYQSYLGLDTLLNCQVPGSKVPDERIFIVTHQMIEMTFKLMIFDIAVIARTFRRLLESDQFIRLCHGGRRDEEDSFWRPALTSSGRLEHSALKVLPELMSYLKEESLFSGVEFFYFRGILSPASGFQSAQFRLLQRALGKSRALEVRLFPGHVYRENYGIPGENPVRVIDEVVLGKDAAVATPGMPPLIEVMGFDDLVHDVLSRLAPFLDEGEEMAPIPRIDTQRVETAVSGYRAMLVRARDEQRKKGSEPSATDLAQDALAVDKFKHDLAEAIDQENLRRDKLTDARKGGVAVKQVLGRESYLKCILDRLVAVDKALHGPQPESFLRTHLDLATNRIKQVKRHAETLGLPDPPSGTGGGGTEYLAHARTQLIDLFPALVAYREESAGEPADLDF